jgi:hypothetical protein
MAAFNQIPAYEHNKLDELAAFMIYEAGLPLSFFKHFAVRAFFHRLRSAYKLLSRKRLLITLLDISY